MKSADTTRSGGKKRAPVGATAARGPSTSHAGAERAGGRAASDRALQQAAYFALFSLPNPASPTRPIPLLPFAPALAVGFSVHEGLHRFEIHGREPNPVCGFKISKAIGQDYVARVNMRMTPMPNNFQGAADRMPPPTLLLPFLSQRFCALDGSLQFLDAEGSGFRAFGCGRTFPATVNGQSQIRLAAVLDITEGFGRLAGLRGTGIVSGETQPPSSFAFAVLFRVFDPDGSLQAHGPIAPLPPDDPKPDTAFLAFLSEPDPQFPLRAESSPDGRRLFVRVAERLRLVGLSFDVGTPAGLRSTTSVGPVVGSHRSTLILDLSGGGDMRTPGAVIPAFSRGGEFRFFDKDGKPVGGFKADLFEARVFPTETPGGRAPFYRLGGIAPPSEGRGQFADPVGMVSVNGAFDLATGAVSTLYMVRLSDPLGLFHPGVI